MLFSAVLLPVLSLLGAVTATPVKRFNAYPDKDSFYTPASGWESKANGAILATRKIQAAALSLIPTLSVSSYQILYKTTDQYDNPLSTVTTVFIPFLADKGKLLSFAVAEDSNSWHCAMSYQYRLGSDSSNLLAQIELILIQLALTQRWVVSTADYEGPNSAFIAGRLQGRSVLDSIRATTAFSSIGLKSNVKIALWGYSGGGNAMGWAAALHSSYAPELNIVGAAHGGTPANLTQVALSLDGGLYSGFLALALEGLSSAYPVIAGKVAQYKTAKYTAVQSVLHSKCTFYDVVANLLTNFNKVGEFFTTAIEDIITGDAEVVAILDTLQLGHVAEVPKVPVFIYHSGSDEIVPYPQAVSMVDGYCSKGVNLEFITNIDHVVGHGLSEVFTIPRSLRFLHDRFDGKAFTSGCTRKSIGVTNLADVLIEALGQGFPLITPFLTAAVAAFNALPAL